MVLVAVAPALQPGCSTAPFELSGCPAVTGCTEDLTVLLAVVTASVSEYCNTFAISVRPCSV